MAKTTVLIRILPDLIEEGVYEVKMNDNTAKITIKRIQNLGTLKNLLGMEVSGTGTVNISGDIHGVANNSEITVELPCEVQSLSSLPDSLMSTQEDQWVYAVQQECLRYINRLLEVIKDKTGQFWLSSLSGRDLYIWSIWEDDIIGRSSKARVQMKIGGIVQEIGGVRNQNDVKDEIQSALSSEEKITVERKMYLDAIHYYVTNRFNESVIAINICLELTSSRKLLQELIEKHGSEAGKKILDKLMRNFSLKRMLDEDFRKIFGCSIKDTNLENKLEMVRNIRQGVVHPYPKLVRMEECGEVIINCLSIMRWIKNCTSQSFLCNS